jgi:hypothetical protein
MTIYICNNCNKEFTIKYNYNRHINKKNICKKILDYKCQYCLKYFTRQDSLKKHIKIICKKKKEINEINLIKLKELELKELELNNYKELKKLELKDNKELKKIELKDNKELKEKELELKEKELNYKINKKQNNIINNTNNITCNINIVAFGSENLEDIPVEKIKSFINRGFMSVVQMVNYLNCNKDLPENHNIYISNRRDDTISTHNGSNWILKEKDSTLEGILNKNGDFLERKYDEYDLKISKFEQFKNGRYNEEQNEFMKSKLNMLLYNNKKLIKKK